MVRAGSLTGSGNMRSNRPQPQDHALDLVKRTEADRHLQAEIDRGFESLLECLSEPFNLRLARVLAAVVEKSWDQHTSFQDEALFPVISSAATTIGEVRILLERLTIQHVEIAECHGEVVTRIRAVISGRSVAGSGLKPALEQTLAARRRHHDDEALLETLIPQRIDGPARDALATWFATAETPHFPVNLILDLWNDP